jgi:hypothetical protein
MKKETPKSSVLSISEELILSHLTSAYSIFCGIDGFDDGEKAIFYRAIHNAEMTIVNHAFGDSCDFPPTP